jgi:cellulose synthase/poly-beta-1,6-N-acetylglucosamine synthase-like glycosyltransferase
MISYLLWTITVFACIFCIAYVVLIAAFCFGWVRTNSQVAASSARVNVAVIIAARNEEAVIPDCLRSLASQAYPSERMEVIIVNDHSEDRTAEIAESFCRERPNWKTLSSEGPGKKNAIATGIKNTTAELIITTDADCSMGDQWIEKITAFYEKSGAAMIAAPVAFKNERSTFEKMQSLEMMALMGSTCGSLYFNRPIMCNGANLAYQRKIYNELNGFEGIDHLASGDDVLLMYKFADAHKGGVMFLKEPEAVVYTGAKNNISEFMLQRKRWASKGFGLLNAETKLVSIVIYLFCFFIVLMGALSGFASIKSAIYLPFLQICLILMGIKCVIDFLLLFLAASFFKKKRYLYLFLPEQFIYILYVVLAGMPGKKKYEWKGRKIN